MSFYDNSPGMVDDIPRPAAAPAPRAPAPAASAAPRPASPAPAAGGSLLGDGPGPQKPTPSPEGAAAAALYSKSQMAETPDKPAPEAPGPDSLAYAPHAEAALPYGPNVENALRRAAETSPNTTLAARADETAKHWAGVFAAHGVPDAEVAHLIDAGYAVARGDLTPATTDEAWPREALERVAAEYGGPENAQRLIGQARAYVQAHPALDRYLNATRLGNHPRVVLSLVNAANRAVNAGKFKR
ncbi:MAG: hypothetical protein QM702_25180 [Rubrivivax sp.]